jgi:hypothetical protein
VPRSWKRCIACVIALAALPAGTAFALAPTVVTTYSPFSPAVRPAAGFVVVPQTGATCATASFVALGPGAFRCAVGDRIHDPCYADPAASPAAAAVVDCVAAPWATRIVRLHLAAPANPALAAPPSLPPWAVRLASGRRCVRTTGATTVVRGRRLSYVCEGDRVLFGRPQTTTPTWRIRQARDTAGAASRDVAIAVAWR